MSSVGHVGAVAPRSAFRQRRALIAAGTGGLALSGLAFGRVLVIAVPIAFGIWLWSQARYERFGRLLVAAGYAWFLAPLAESSNSVLYSIGRIPCADGRQARWVA